MSTTAMGKNWRLMIGDGANSEVYHTLAGEKSFDWSQDSNDVDTSDKDGPSGVFTPGRIKIGVQGNVKLPDASFTRIAAAALAGTPVDIKIVDGAIVKFACPVTVGNLKYSAAADGTVPYSFDMANYAVPTVNALDAVA